MKKKTGWPRAASAIEENLLDAMKESDIEGIGEYARELGGHLLAVERTLEAYSDTGGLFCYVKAAGSGKTEMQAFKLPDAVEVGIALLIPSNETAVQIEDALRQADANANYDKLTEMVEWLSKNPEHGIIEYDTTTEAGAGERRRVG